MGEKKNTQKEKKKKETHVQWDNLCSFKGVSLHTNFILTLSKRITVFVRELAEKFRELFEKLLTSQHVSEIAFFFNKVF